MRQVEIEQNSNKKLNLCDKQKKYYESFRFVCKYFFPREKNDDKYKMSGIYLTVWEDTSTRLLNPTKGGYPHVTVAYTGKSVGRKELSANL